MYPGPKRVSGDDYTGVTTVVFIDNTGKLFQGTSANLSLPGSQISMSSGLVSVFSVVPNVPPEDVTAFDIAYGSSSPVTTVGIIDEFQENEFAWTASRNGTLSNLEINAVAFVNAVPNGVLVLQAIIRRATTTSDFADTVLTTSFAMSGISLADKRFSGADTTHSVSIQQSDRIVLQIRVTSNATLTANVGASISGGVLFT